MSEVLFRIFFLLVIFAASFLVVQFLLNRFSDSYTNRKAVNRRMELIRRGEGRERVMGELLKNQPRRFDGLPKPLQSLLIRFDRMVFASAIPITMGQLLVGMAVATVFIFAAVAVLAATFAGMDLGFGKLQLIALFALALGFAIPWLVLSRMAQARRKKMEQQFPVALDIFVRALRSGHPVASAIELLTTEMEDPIGSEFGLVSDEVSYGAELVPALAALAERWNLDDIRMFVVSIAVQNETGGNLAEILENLAKVIRERAQMFMTVRALSSEGRMTGWMLTGLPIFAFVTVFLGRPQFYFDVADDPIFIVGSIGLLGMYVSGVIMIRKMVDLKV